MRALPLLDEERVLVELACGASLAAVYSGLIRRLQDEGNSSVIFKDIYHLASVKRVKE